MTTVVALAFTASCSDDEDPITDSKITPFELHLADHGTEYDQRIHNWYDRTGCYILYEFEDRDVYFAGSDEWQEYHADTLIDNSWYEFNDAVYLNAAKDSVWLNAAWHPLNEQVYDEYGEFWQMMTVEDNKLHVRQQVLQTSGNLNVKPAKPEYVGQQLTYVEQKFLNFYPDSILRHYLPIKIILGRDLTTSYMRHGYKRVHQVNYTNSTYNMLFNHGDSSVNQLGRVTAYSLNSEFIIRHINPHLNLDRFFRYSSYTSNPDDDSQLFAWGLLEENSMYATEETNRAQDQGNFFRLIAQHSYEWLTTDDYGDDEYWNLKGCLNPARDVNGLLMRKYNAMIAAYKAAGVDLQAIGNATNSDY